MRKPTTADIYMSNLKTLHKMKVLIDRIYGDEHLKEPQLATALFDSCEELVSNTKSMLYMQRASKNGSNT